jgi:hypothetical protein
MYGDNAATLLADAIASPVTEAAAHVRAEAESAREAARPAGSADAIRIEAAAALAASRWALADYARVMDCGTARRPGPPKTAS